MEKIHKIDTRRVRQKRIDWQKKQLEEDGTMQSGALGIPSHNSFWDYIKDLFRLIFRK
jgi:hypothetical protein